jgi:hypothetical protein
MQYTANLAAALTAAAVSTGIRTLQDLVGYPVAAHGVYVPRLSQVGSWMRRSGSIRVVHKSSCRLGCDVVVYVNAVVA